MKTQKAHVAVIGPASPRELLSEVPVAHRTVPVGLGGTPITALVKGLSAAGHPVTLITASPDLSEPWTGRKDRLAIRAVPYRSRARSRALDFFAAERRYIAEELADSRVDIVHAHWFYEFALPALQSGLPAVITAHDAPLQILRKDPSPYRAVRTLMAYATRARLGNTIVTAVSPYLAQKVRRELLYRKHIEVIPNASPFRRSDPAPQPPTPIFLDIADGSPRKNAPTLLRAFAIVRSQLPTAGLVLIGPGLGAFDAIAKQAEKDDLHRGVSFLGVQPRHEVRRLLRESTALVHASLEESQGMCLIEAMSTGTPIIGGLNAGGVAWTVGDGRAGILVDTREPSSLASAMLNVASDTALEPDIVTNGYRLLEDRYAPKAVAQRYSDIYERALCGSSCSAPEGQT